MKISKLFHWLYALVMLLPIFAIGVTCLVTTFNKNVNYSGQEQTIQYEEINNLEIGERYYFNGGINNSLNQTGRQLNLQLFINNVDIEYTNYSFFTNDTRKISLYLNNNNQKVILYAFDSNNINTGSATIDNYFLINFKFTLTDYYIADSNDLDYFKPFIFSNFDSTNNNALTQNVFYYAVDKVREAPIFSWAYDSFLVAPFAYIVALFGMPTNHLIVQLLSYWLAISIIWLVFDLVMYVPLLIHRWLDKGVLE